MARLEMPASLSPSSSTMCVVSATRWLLVADSAAIRFCAADHPGVVCTDSLAVTTTSGLSPRGVSTCVWRNRSGMLANSSRALRQPRGAALERRDLPGCRLGEAGPGGGRDELPDAQPGHAGQHGHPAGALERVEPPVPVTW